MKLEKKFMHQVKKLDSALELSGAAQGVQEGLRDVRRYIDLEFKMNDDQPLSVDLVPTSEKSRTYLRHTGRRPSQNPNTAEEHIDICSIERLTESLLKFSTAIDHFDSYTDRESNDSLRKVQTAYWVSTYLLRFVHYTQSPNLGIVLHNEILW